MSLPFAFVAADASADLRITLQKSPGSIAVDDYKLGEEITYTITVDNLGPGNETGIKVNLVLPGQIKSTTPSNGVAMLAATPDNSISSGYWTISSMVSGSSATLKVVTTLRVASNAGASVSVAGAGVDKNQPNNFANLFFCVVPAAAGEIQGPTAVCTGQAYTYQIAAVPGASFYTWTFPADWDVVVDPDNQEIATVRKAGSSGKVSVAVGNTCGVGPARVLDVTATTGKPIITSPVQGKQYPCVNTLITYDITPVSGASGYSWTVPEGWAIQGASNGSSISVKVGSANGQVTVKAVNNCGEGDIKSLDVFPQSAAPAVPTITGESSVCQGSGGHSYSIPAVPGATYSWAVPQGWQITAGQGTNNITVNAGSLEGNVSVTVSNDCNLSATASFAVKMVPSPPPTPKEILGLSVVCANQTNITYTIAPVPGATSYRWEAPGWKIVSGGSTTTVTLDAGTTGTTISVVAINACGVTSAVQKATVVAQAAPQKPGPITGNALPCVGKTYTYTIAAVANTATYTWGVPQGWTVVSQEGTTLKVVAGSQNGDISVTAANGCGAGATTTLPVKPVSGAPAGLKINGPANVCAGSVVTYSLEPGVSASGYSWSVSVDKGWAIQGAANGTSVTVKVGTADGTVSITATNDCDAATKSLPVAVSTAAPVQLGPISGKTTMCAGATETYTIQPVAGAASYAWTLPQGWTIISGDGTTSITVKTTATAGQVAVAGVNACGAGGTKSVLAVAPLAGPPAAPTSIRQSVASFCGGTPGIVFNIDPIAGATAYTWSVPQGWQITAGQGTTSITVTAGTAAGDLKVYATNTCGQGNSQSLALAPQQLPAAPKLTAGPAEPCNGSSTSYSVEPLANVDSYTWELPQGWTILSGAGTASITVLPTATAGTLKVSAVTACGTGSATMLVVTPVTGKPTAPGMIRGEASVCTGRTVTYTVDAALRASSYAWTLPEGWTIVEGQGSTTITAKAGSQGGTLTVEAVNGCGNSLSATMALNAQPLAELGEIVDLSTPCAGLSYEVAPVAGASKYTWSVPDGWEITSGQGTNKVTVNPGTTTGNIGVVVDNGICQSEPSLLTPNTNLRNSEIIVPNVFSPNGDGNNDTWVIRNLENYPDNDLTVINRWGNEVYRSNAYKNNWNGSNLSEGTYYYVVRAKMCDGTSKLFKGYVTIVR
ncbi:gliding motility-associated C-terminal domain-containing protein [Pontibacter liquoris]|uniref:T9SS type B sorting domain-containing protein n=1 Tax=Pontibacter liquoris TaxID=2905677 RepID=UPI001FA7EDE3